MKNNLSTIFCQYTQSEFNQGVHWYSDSKDFFTSLSEKTGVPLKVVCGIAAALSPRLNWKKNVEYTIDICKNRRVRGLKKNIEKARSIKKTGIVMKYLSGPKVTSFFLNLLGNHNEITIDTLMINCYHNNFIKQTLTTSEKEDFIQTIQDIANKTKLSNAQVQAIIWVVWHRVTKSNFPGYVNFLKIF